MIPRFDISDLMCLWAMTFAIYNMMYDIYTQCYLYNMKMFVSHVCMCIYTKACVCARVYARDRYTYAHIYLRVGGMYTRTHTHEYQL